MKKTFLEGKITVKLVYIQVSSFRLVEQFEDQIGFRWSWKKWKHLYETESYHKKIFQSKVKLLQGKEWHPHPLIRQEKLYRFTTRQ